MNSVLSSQRVVLTRESGEGKLEEVESLHEGKRRCKRHNERLQKSSKHRWRQRFSELGEQAFPGSGHQLPHEEEMRRLQRENELLRQERDILKKALGIFSRSQRMPLPFHS